MNINLRSPYHITVTDANLTSCLIELYVYTGTQTADRGVAKYTLETIAYNNTVTFEISELVRDYLDITFDGTYTSQTVWVDYQITKYILESPTTPNEIVKLIGFDGYGYFEDGVNPQLDNALLQSNTIDYVLSGQPYVVPVNSNETIDVKFYLNDVLQNTVLAPDTLESSELILYASETAIDKAIIDNGITTTTIKINTVEECKHTPYKITFINKFGAKQNIWFFKKSNLDLTTTKEEYKSNILNNGTYDISNHQKRILKKQGNEKLVLNTGFVDEQMNEVFRQLMLSEQVWLDIDNKVLPINIINSSFAYKTSLNDGLINYTINCEFAFDKINNIK